MMNFFIEPINRDIQNANINEIYILKHNVDDISVDKFLTFGREANIKKHNITLRQKYYTLV